MGYHDQLDWMDYCSQEWWLNYPKWGIKQQRFSGSWWPIVVDMDIYIYEYRIGSRFI